MTEPVTLRLPSVLADLVDGRRSIEVSPAPANVAALLDAVEADHPVVVRRIRDETGALRRFVNVYVGNDDVRFLDDLATPTPDGTQISVIPAVAGGC